MRRMAKKLNTQHEPFKLKINDYSFLAKCPNDHNFPFKMPLPP